ncbi:MAG: YlbF family regulator [Planctomycetota bacterium]|nr:YlbF family regulator [Planctomycetota bacterium]
MPTTQDILDAAQKLGKLIASHDSAGKLEAAARKLQGDVEAQRILTDYNRHLEKVSEKEATGKPIEVADKQQLEKLQGAVVRNPILRDFQVAQMDYLDLMRRVDEAMAGGEPAAAAPAPGAGALGAKPGLKLS